MSVYTPRKYAEQVITPHTVVLEEAMTKWASVQDDSKTIDADRNEATSKLATVIYFLADNARWAGRPNYDNQYDTMSPEVKMAAVMRDSAWYRTCLHDIITRCMARSTDMLRNVMRQVTDLAGNDIWFPLDMDNGTQSHELTYEVCTRKLMTRFDDMDKMSGGDWWSFGCTDGRMYYVNGEKHEIFAHSVFYSVGQLKKKGEKYHVVWQTTFDRRRLLDVARVLGEPFISFITRREMLVTLDEYYRCMSVICVAMGASIYTRIPPHKFKCLVMGFAKMLQPIKHTEVSETVREILKRVPLESVKTTLHASGEHMGTPIPCKSCGKTDTRLMRCSKCQRVKYCSVSCQRADWQNHKSFCADNAELVGKTDAPYIVVSVPTAAAPTTTDDATHTTNTTDVTKDERTKATKDHNGATKKDE